MSAVKLEKPTLDPALLEERRMLLKGNHAVSYGVMRCRPEVIAMYPITPQTPIVEKIADLALNGEIDAEIMTCES
ncbi:MAG: pyruvate ferredoxin oxidoreductase, partial [Actinobacteria bacterium]|nr:pyruvate ferredoxin oxidoreductase [Actinomycetota bacterium]